MNHQYDLVVVGTGVTSAVASRCREAGWTVAVVDSRPFGGTCALRGCVPKKILVSATEAVHARATWRTGRAGRHADDRLGPPHPVQAFTRRSDTQRTEQAWAKMGIEQFHGRPASWAGVAGGRR